MYMCKILANHGQIQWPANANFPIPYGFMKGEAAYCFGNIGCRKWYYGTTFSGKFLSLCVKNCGCDAHISPFLGGFGPIGQKWPELRGILCSKRYYKTTCSGDFWSLCDKYGGRDAQISRFGGDFAPFILGPATTWTPGWDVSTPEQFSKFVKKMFHKQICHPIILGSMSRSSKVTTCCTKSAGCAKK